MPDDAAKAAEQPPKQPIADVVAAVEVRPAASPPPPASPAVPAEPPAGLSADEERQLGELLAKRDAAAAAAGMVRLRIEPTEEMRAIEMQFGGTAIGTEWREVPERQVPHMFNAAAAAGVNLIRES